MAGCTHFGYSPETVFGTWVTPAKFIPIETEDIGSAREMLDLRVTGSCRSLFDRVLGAKSVSGSLTTYLWQSYIGSMLKTFMRDTATTGSGDPYTHALLFDDSVGLLGNSLQKIYKASATAVGQNVLSAVVSSFTITAAAKEKVVLGFGFEAKDEGLAGATWDYDGSACPAVVGSPTYAAVARPYMFYDARVSWGGTAALASNIITISSGTDYAKISNLEIGVDLGVDTDGFGLTDDPTRVEIWPGNREITVSFDISWTDYASTFYTAARAGTSMALELDLAISANREVHIIVPSVIFDPNKLPPLTGDSAKKVLSLTGKAVKEATTAKDFNIWFESAEATI